MKRYRLIKYPWHTGHDYELSKLSHDFFYLNNTYRRWASQHRPVPPNIEWCSNYAFVPSDAMILHVDQWTYHEPSKRFLFLRYRDSYSGPKIVINHGCNMVDGCSTEELKRLVDGCCMVCNSHAAHERWGLENSRTIIHGMSPEEWPITDYSRENILVVQGMSHPAVRNNKGVEQVEEVLPIDWVGRDIGFSSFEAYKAYLGTSSIFFNPSFASANPRTRTEAMLSGLAVVTTCSHGEEEYIVNGENGFCSNDFDELIDFLRYLKAHPEKVQEIGKQGRATAQRLFHIDRFKKDWDQLLSDYLQ